MEVSVEEPYRTPEQQYVVEHLFLESLRGRPKLMVATGTIDDEFDKIVYSHCMATPIVTITEAEFSTELLDQHYSTIQRNMGSAPTHMVFTGKVMTSLIASIEPNLSWFEPTQQLRTIQKGCMGKYMGMHMLTDAHMHPMLRFVPPGCHLYREDS